MTVDQRKEVLMAGIQAAREFTLNSRDSFPVFESVAEILFKKLQKISSLSELRIYIVKEGEEILEEKINYTCEGAEIGHDSIPFYQLPREILEKKSSRIAKEEDNMFYNIPLLKEKQLIGMLDLKMAKKEAKPFVSQLEKMAGIISLGLNQLLFQKNNLFYKSYFNSALEINERLQSIDNLAELISVFLKYTVTELKLDRVSVFLLDENEDDIVYQRCVCKQEKEYELEEKPEIPNFDSDYYLEDRIDGCWFSLKTSNRQIGYLLYDNIYTCQGISDRLIEILRILSSQFSTAIDNLRLFSQLQQNAHYDELTGLYNRTYLEKKLDNYNRKNQMPLSVIYGDVNGLKITNDVFGHQEGDEILRGIAQILQEVCREDDLIVRWGGDEFIIFLPQTETENVNQICSRIKNNCSRASFTRVKLNIALGHATINSVDQDIRQAINLAEERMYKQKLRESNKFRKSLISSLHQRMIDNSQETIDHLDRMVRLVDKMGKELELSSREREDLRLLAVVHDIGNVALPEKILNKEDILTKKEWQKVKKHVEIGYRITRASFNLAPLADYILAHHEWWDGTGYPLQKKEEEIPLLARVLSIVDAYDVMTEERSFSQALTRKEALKELENKAGIQFDPELVKKFKEIIYQEDWESNYEKMITLESEAEANLLKLFLQKKDIPHRISAYYDQIYGEIFVSRQGWGYVESKEKFRPEIREVYEEIKKNLDSEKDN